MSAFPQCISLPSPQFIPEEDEPAIYSLELSQRTVSRKQYRWKLWSRHPYCRFCGRKIGQYKSATLDHLQPQAQGGGDQLWNLVLSCQQCNHTKANRTVEQWAADILHGAEPDIPQA